MVEVALRFCASGLRPASGRLFCTIVVMRARFRMHGEGVSVCPRCLRRGSTSPIVMCPLLFHGRSWGIWLRQPWWDLTGINSDLHCGRWKLIMNLLLVAASLMYPFRGPRMAGSRHTSRGLHSMAIVFCCIFVAVVLSNVSSVLVSVVMRCR